MCQKLEEGAKEEKACSESSEEMLRLGACKLFSQHLDAGVLSSEGFDCINCFESC